MKHILILIACLIAACGAPGNADLADELGEAEQAQYSLVYKPGGGNQRVLGNQGHEEPISMGPPRQNSGCSTTQLGGTVCFFTKTDPLFDQEEGNWYGIRMVNGWHQGIITDATNAFNNVISGMQTFSEVEAGGTEINLLNFYNPPGGSSDPEIVLNNVDLGFTMPPTPSRAMQLYVRAAFTSLSSTLTEDPSFNLPGTWKSSGRCTVNIDATDLTTHGKQAVINAGQGTPGTYDLMRQAIGYGINMCLGLGRKNHSITTNYTPFTHGLLDRNVWNGSNFFDADDKCLIWKSNIKSTTNTLILWAGATCP